MNYQLFAKLYREAAEYNDLDMYIGERGWQEWMNNYKTEQIGRMLAKIYSLAKNDFETNRKLITTNRSEFARMYSISVRTLENWAGGQREIPSYVKEMIDYTIFESDFYESD